MKESYNNPDGQWKWVVAFATFCVVLILAGIYRTSGILLVAFINAFEVSREQASLPLIIWFSIMDLAGIVVGPLGHRYGIRFVTIAGSLIGSIGFSAGYFVPDLSVITFSFGIFGCGFSFSYTLASVIINQYFPSSRATMNGIVFSSACLGSIIFPPLYEYLIYTYGLVGCLLLISGIILQISIFGALMRPPTLPRKPQDITKSNKCSYIPGDCVRDYEITNDEERYFGNQVSNSDLVISKMVFQGGGTEFLAENNEMKQNYVKETINELSSDDGEFQSKAHSVDSVPSQTSDESKKKESDFTDFEYSETEKELATSSHKSVPAIKLSECEKLISSEVNSQPENGSRSSILYVSKSEIPSLQPRTAELVDSRSGKPSSILEISKHVLTCPMFYIYTITCIVFYFNYQMFLVINVDYCLDRGVVDMDTKYILFSFSVFDLFGRLSLGWITDRNFLKRSHFLMLTMAGMATLFFSFPFAYGIFPLLLISAMYGLLLGCTLIIFNVILLDYLDMEMQEVAFGFVNFLNGIATLAYIFLIGYFRDNLGSYSNIFFLLGSTSLAASFLWLFESYFTKGKDRRSTRRTP